MSVQTKVINQKLVGFNGFTHFIAVALLKLLGWSIHMELPKVPKYIMVGAPHTSNWDWVLMLLLTRAINLRLHWAAKDSAFRGPFGSIMRALGGIPINRRERTSMVDQIVEVFNNSDEFVLAITPEGTRSKVSTWKTGFYHIAQKANVPIFLVALDGTNRKIIGHLSFHPSGDILADMDIIRGFYAGKKGINPNQTSVPRLAMELEENNHSNPE